MDQDHPATLLGQDEPLGPEAGDGPRRTERRPRRPAGQDAWIDARLRSLYDAVVAEPLPAELQAMVDRLLDEPPPSSR